VAVNNQWAAKQRATQKQIATENGADSDGESEEDELIDDEEISRGASDWRMKSETRDVEMVGVA